MSLGILATISPTNLDENYALGHNLAIYSKEKADTEFSV
ncbi:protein of unknown function [Shewanella benthica]|uniref:Uncharacterized protein n=1 Tax=Shewanella benthica TaxID=43661 RepID=A0A330M5F0_9GAMM|nr:protein of unknown function [Shewanella benthica]